MSEIKICGLFRPRDIEYVNEAGPEYAGFVLNFPKSHRSLSPEEASVLRRKLSDHIRAVCVVVDQPLEELVDAVRIMEPDVIQLHGHEDNDYIRALKEKTGLTVWRAFRIRSADDLSAAAASCADEVLLDNGYGTGETFTWSDAVGFTRPFILAGGLTPENIPEARRLLDPKILDISSGVETDRLKDRSKILAAVKAAHL